MSDDLRWLIVHTKPNMENLASFHLKRQGFRVWWWHRLRQRSVGRPQHRRTRAEMASYFPRYLFVRETGRLDLVNETDGVSTVLHATDVGLDDPALITVDNADLLKLASEIGVEGDGYVPAKNKERPPELQEGTYFWFADDTPFHRLLGIIAETVPLDGQTKVKAYLRLFGRETLLTVPQDHIGHVEGD